MQYSPSFFPVLSVKKYNPLKIKELYNLRIKDENRKNMISLIENSEVKEVYHTPLKKRDKKKKIKYSRIQIWWQNFHHIQSSMIIKKEISIFFFLLIIFFFLLTFIDHLILHLLLLFLLRIFLYQFPWLPQICNTNHFINNPEHYISFFHFIHQTIPWQLHRIVWIAVCLNDLNLIRKFRNLFLYFSVNFLPFCFYNFIPQVVNVLDQLNHFCDHFICLFLKVLISGRITSRVNINLKQP